MSLQCFRSELSANTDPPVTGRTILLQNSTNTAIMHATIKYFSIHYPMKKVILKAQVRPADHSVCAVQRKGISWQHIHQGTVTIKLINYYGDTTHVPPEIQR